MVIGTGKRNGVTDYADYQKIGNVLTNFLLSIVNYKAPNVNTNIKTT
jgi:hypothetical protein